MNVSSVFFSSPQILLLTCKGTQVIVKISKHVGWEEQVWESLTMGLTQSARTGLEKRCPREPASACLESADQGDGGSTASGLRVQGLQNHLPGGPGP